MKLLSLQAGSTHEVIIEVEGTPAPELKFFKDGVEIKSSERIRIVKESEELYKIIINDCKLTDTGSYSVVATLVLSTIFSHLFQHRLAKNMIYTTLHLY